MEPMTALIIASTAVSAMSSIQQGNAQAANYEAASKAAAFNADVAAQNAKAAYETGYAQEEQVRREGRQALGAQAAAIGQSGFDPTSGSALALAKQSEARAELDALTARHQGILMAHGYLSQSSSELANAQNLQSNASRARQAGYWNAFVNAPLQGASTYLTMNRLGYGGYGPSGGAPLGWP